MFTYQIRPRIYALTTGSPLEFPADCEICFHFLPLQPFGLEAGGGRTFARDSEHSVLFNANTGQCWIESEKPLSPLDVILQEPTRTIQLSGRSLTIKEKYESLIDMNRVINAVFFVLPILINSDFADPTYIERVDGTVGASGFRWQMVNSSTEFRSTSQVEQEERFARAWERMGLVCDPGSTRIMAGLHYFYVACRLARESTT